MKCASSEYNGFQSIRFQFYGARMISEQLNSGENYQILKEVIQIIFIKGKILDEDFIVHYTFKSDKNNIEKNCLIHRYYICLDMIEENENMSEFEILCLAFKISSIDGILKLRNKGKVVDIIMKKIEEMKKNEQYWSTAQAIEDARITHESELSYMYNEGITKGLNDGKIALLNTLIKKRFNTNEEKWLKTLELNELELLTDKLLEVETLDELKKLIK